MGVEGCYIPVKQSLTTVRSVLMVSTLVCMEVQVEPAHLAATTPGRAVEPL